MATFLVFLLVIVLMVIAFGFMTISYEIERRAYEKTQSYEDACCLG